jgi:hypothetical protein
MSVASTTCRMSPYTGDDVTTEFPYTFKIFVSSELRVTKRRLSTGAETRLTLDTDYTVDGVGETGGGNVTLGSALASGYKLYIRRVRPLTQNTAIRNESTFFASTHEDQFDKQVMVSQQQQDELDRSAKLPETILTSEFDPALPADIANSPGKILTVNDDSDGFELKEASAVLGLTSENDHAVTDGQAATNLVGETVDSEISTSVVYDYEIIRGTTVFSTGRFSLHYRNSTWYVVMGEDRRDDDSSPHGVTFSVSGTTTAQLRAALDSGAGNGTIKLKKHRFSA